MADYEDDLTMRNGTSLGVLGYPPVKRIARDGYHRFMVVLVRALAFLGRHLPKKERDRLPTTFVVPPSSPGSYGDEAMVCSLAQRYAASSDSRLLKILTFEAGRGWPEVDATTVLEAPWVLGWMMARAAIGFFRSLAPGDRVVWVATDTIDGGHDAPSLRRMTAFLESARKCGCSVAVVNFSLRPSATLTREAERVLRHAARVIVRDRKSAETLRLMGLAPVLAPDVAYSYEGPAARREHVTGPLQVNVSGHALAFSGHPHLIDDLARAIAEVSCPMPSVAVELLAHDMRALTGDRESTQALAAALTELGVRHTVVAHGLPPSEVRETVGRAVVVLTTRMHHAIAALSMGRPVVCVTYFHDKFVGQLEWFGWPAEFIIRAEDATADRVAAAVIEAWRDRKALEARITQALPDVRRLSAEAADGYLFEA